MRPVLRLRPGHAVRGQTTSIQHVEIVKNLISRDSTEYSSFSRLLREVIARAYQLTLEDYHLFVFDYHMSINRFTFTPGHSSQRPPIEVIYFSRAMTRRKTFHHGS